jgi:hypothetical protein
VSKLANENGINDNRNRISASANADSNRLALDRIVFDNRTVRLSRLPTMPNVAINGKMYRINIASDVVVDNMRFFLSRQMSCGL